VSAQLLGGQQAAVQAETMAGGPRGETVGEDFGEIFRRDARAIVNHGNAYPVIAVAHAEGDATFFAVRAIFAVRSIAGIFGVADQVHQDLQDFVFLHGDLRELRLVFANDLDRLTRQRPEIHQQGVFHQAGDADGFGHAGKPGVICCNATISLTCSIFS